MTTEEKPRENTKHVHVSNGSTGGILWTIGWLFTIAFAKLIWWQALVGLIVWPYYLGLALR
jgi:hypothetical protein